MTNVKDCIENSIVDDTPYNVVMFNDDVTPFEYVIAVLNQIFQYEVHEALQVAIHIHQNGKAIVATMSMQAAYEKIEAVDRMNQMFGFLLQTNVERA
jgi:ATP-dependent Clp protease adaptor protein ClpS